MEKILTAIENHADDGPRAADIYFETANMDKRELAEYVAAHKDELKELLGIRDLASKEGSPETSKEFWELVRLGNSIMNTDPYTRHDYYGEDLPTVDDYMEKFGVQKEKGEFSDETKAAFTNPNNPAYFGNYDKDMIRDLALQEGLSVDEYLNKIRRTTDEWRRTRKERGYDPEGGVDIGKWLYDLGEEIAFPRLREARIAGKDWEMNDLVGDLAELGLSFAPGTGLISRATGKVVANWPKTVRILSNMGVNAVESAAVPLGSQALDVALYGDDDPRGKWDWDRVGAQYAGAIGAKGALKVGARAAKGVAEMEGKAGSAKFRDAMDVIEDIGYDAKNSIAKRGAIQEQRARTATNEKYNDKSSFLTPEQNKTGYFGDVSDVKAYNDFMIRKAEAERLAKSQDARKAFAKAREEATRADGDYFAADNMYRKMQRDIQEGAMVPKKEQMALEAKREAALKRREESAQKMAKAKEDYIKANSDGHELVQLDDGTFVENKGGVVGGWKMPLYGDERLPKYEVSFNNGNTVFLPDVPSKVTVLKNFDEPIPEPTTIKVGKVEQSIDYAPRDKVVRKAIGNDKDFDSVASGRSRWNKPVNTATNIGFNAAAREGIVGQGLDMDEKRQAALYNQMLSKLRPLVAESDKSPEGKRRTVDAIMNVMTYGLDNLPEEMYKKDRATYKAIAKQLGSSDWSHWSDNKVKDYPTTSY